MVPKTWNSFPPTGLGYSKHIQEIVIQNRLELLQLSLDQFSTMFFKFVALHGSNLLHQNIDIQSASSLGQLDVPKMRKLLQDTMATCKDIKDNNIFIEADIHDLIEDCRTQKREIDKQIDGLSMKKAAMEVQIQNHQESIDELYELAKQYERHADTSSYHARENDRKSEESFKWGAAEVVAGIGGAVFTFATGGTALAFVPLTGILGFGVKNVYDSAIYNEVAKGFRRDALFYRNGAEGSKKEVNRLLTEIRNIEENIDSALHQQQELEVTVYTVCASFGCSGRFHQFNGRYTKGDGRHGCCNKRGRLIRRFLRSNTKLFKKIAI